MDASVQLGQFVPRDDDGGPSWVLLSAQDTNPPGRQTARRSPAHRRRQTPPKVSGTRRRHDPRAFSDRWQATNAPRHPPALAVARALLCRRGSRPFGGAFIRLGPLVNYHHGRWRLCGVAVLVELLLNPVAVDASQQPAASQRSASICTRAAAAFSEVAVRPHFTTRSAQACACATRARACRSWNSGVPRASDAGWSTSPEEQERFAYWQARHLEVALRDRQKGCDDCRLGRPMSARVRFNAVVSNDRVVPRPVPGSPALLF